jgi:hydroxymethylbilane synthase
VPLGAHARVDGERLEIRGFVATPDGTQRIASAMQGSVADADAIGTALAEKLLADGGAPILESLLAKAGRVLAPPTH